LGGRLNVSYPRTFSVYDVAASTAEFGRPEEFSDRSMIRG
jgi:hypothetical protein